MKAIIKGGIMVMLITAFSCNKSFLERQPKSATDANSAIVDINSMQYALNGIYALLKSANYYDCTFYLLPDLVSDNVYLSRINTLRWNTMGAFSTIPTNAYIDDLYIQTYSSIANCNLFIQQGGDLKVVSSDSSTRNALIGQAYAIRAEGYFDLCRIFAQPYNFTSDASQLGVPLVLSSSFNTTDIVNPARSTVKEVYNAVINDFEKAISLLPENLPGQSSSFKGMITLNAAKALLSRVYLYMGDWADCEEMATEVINSGQYSLSSTNNLVQDYSTPNNSESIFEIVNTATDQPGTSSVNGFYNQSGYGELLPTWNLYNLYSPTDVRLNFMAIGNRKGSGGETGVPIVTEKFIETGGLYDQDISVIRLAEVYLNRAEARAHLGEDEGAIEDLTTIAKRADPSVIIDSTLSGQALIDRILLERRKELAFEGQRLFDLTRNKLGFVKYYAGGDSTIVDYPNEKIIFPIPQSEIYINPALQQNPGY
ncbi:MAG TPA: RagB/SusD family nutrient uptake outer membrane protein [Ginsengibacter sp.]